MNQRSLRAVVLPESEASSLFLYLSASVLYSIVNSLANIFRHFVQMYFQNVSFTDQRYFGLSVAVYVYLNS